MLIGIGHRSGHGKDTFADMMVLWLEKYRPELKVVKWPWARKLKLICFDLYKQFGHREPDFYDTDEGRALRNIPLPIIGKTPVEIWIDMGEGIRDKVYQHTWRDFVRDNIEADVIILSDTRKPTELEICDVRIKVTNPRIPNRVGKSIDHELADYDGWHYEIVNDYTKRYLECECDRICWEIFTPGYKGHGKI